MNYPIKLSKSNQFLESADKHVSQQFVLLILLNLIPTNNEFISASAVLHY